MSSQPVNIHMVLPDNFIASVENYLEAHPQGFKEYDLIKHLDDQKIFQSYEDRKCPSLQMFQKHFLLFHVLYLINNKMISERTGSIKISPLLIQKYSYVETQQEMDAHDPLSEYYLDFNNLNKATEETVADLLNSFWTEYLKNDKRQASLAALNLADPVEDHEIKSTYHQLVSFHHPDRGGDSEQIKAINTAYANLIKP